MEQCGCGREQLGCGQERLALTSQSLTSAQAPRHKPGVSFTAILVEF